MVRFLSPLILIDDWAKSYQEYPGGENNNILGRQEQVHDKKEKLTPSYTSTVKRQGYHIIRLLQI